MKLTFHLACHLNLLDFSFPFISVDVWIYLLYSFNNIVIDQVGLRERWDLHGLGVTIKVMFVLYKMRRDFLQLNFHLDDYIRKKKLE